MSRLSKTFLESFLQKINNTFFPNATSKIFVTIVSNRKSLTNFRKSSSLDPALKSVFMNKQNTNKKYLQKIHYENFPNAYTLDVSG